MNCPSELNCSRYVDDALPTDACRELEAHIRGCADCRTLIDALTAERNLLRQSMQAAAVDGVIPAFVPRPTISRLLVWLGWTTIALWGVSAVWLSVMDSLSPPSWLSWLSPSAISTGIQLFVSTVMPGDSSTALMDGLLGTARSATIALLAIFCFGWLVRHQPRGATMPVIALGIFGTLLTAAPETQAFELRHDEQRVIVGPDEVIDDTLIVRSEDVTIEGRITGDLIVVGETLVIRGEVDGLVIAMGETIQLEGTFRHSVLSLGELVNVRSSSLGGNFYAAGERVVVQQDTKIAGNAVAAGEETELNGTVGRDLVSAGSRVTLFGSVDGNMRGYGETVELTETARVSGNLTLKTENSESAIIAPAADIGGETSITAWPEEPNRYATTDFYLGELLQILAAFITGWVLFRFVPGLARVELEGSVETLVTAGIGAAILIGTPVLSLVAMATLIGIPIGLIALMTWLAALYAAGIVISGYVGRLLLPGHGGGVAVPLLLGLTLLVVLSEIPFLGGPVKLVAGILGLGLIGQWIRSLWVARTA